MKIVYNRLPSNKPITEFILAIRHVYKKVDRVGRAISLRRSAATCSSDSETDRQATLLGTNTSSSSSSSSSSSTAAAE